jgi:hypothetical protein
LLIVIAKAFDAIVAPLMPENERLAWLVWMPGAATVKETVTGAVWPPELKVTVPLYVLGVSPVGFTPMFTSPPEPLLGTLIQG